MTAGRFPVLAGAIAALFLSAGAPADPLPQGAAAPNAPDVVNPPDKAPQPTPVMEQNDVPAVAPKEVAPPAPAEAQTAAPEANAAAPKNVEPVPPAQAFSVLGKKVHGPDGKEVFGSISDILVDDQGRPRAAIIDFGGFLGVGTRKVAVDWRVLHFPQKGAMDALIADLSKDQVRAAPAFKPGEAVVIMGGGTAEPAASASPSTDAPTAPAGPPAPKP